MSIYLDPREVLKYLNQLGYCNITKEQLKEFIYDLKQLVKYDSKNCERAHSVDGRQIIGLDHSPVHANRKPASPIKRGSNKTKYKSRPNEISCSKGLCAETSPTLLAPCNTRSSSYANTCPRGQGEKIKSKPDKQNEKFHATSSAHSSGSSRESSLYSCTSDGNSIDEFDSYPKAEKVLDYNDVKDSKVPSMQSVKISTKTTTSFIRPWRLVSVPKNGPDRRNDPVALYQHYQTIWKKQKMPGENNHAELRWSIREKMLGQDPHPRPISRASSVEHLKKTHRPMKK